ncbi:MAG: response regulator [Aureliella sp.]
MKVSIADDDLVSRRLLQSYLQKWDYKVSVTKNAQDYQSVDKSPHSKESP